MTAGTPLQQGMPSLDCGMFFDPAQRGSRWGQVGTGLLGIVLAAVLVIGQVSLATSRGIETHLKRNVTKLREGNHTMESIISQGEPSVHVEVTVRHQQAVLEHTRKTMHALNKEMGGIGATTDDLAGTVGQMRGSSAQLATGVGSMDASTAKLAALLGPLPAKAEATGTALAQINTDSGDINTELTAISSKMERYGLPHAEGVQRR